MSIEYGLEFGLLKLLVIYFYIWVNISFPNELILDLYIIKSFFCN